MTILHAKHTAATQSVTVQDGALSDKALNDVHGAIDIGAVGSAVTAAATTATTPVVYKGYPDVYSWSFGAGA
jgi:hypothetical protein